MLFTLAPLVGRLRWLWGPATTCRQTARWRSGSRSPFEARVSDLRKRPLISTPLQEQKSPSGAESNPETGTDYWWEVAARAQVGGRRGRPRVQQVQVREDLAHHARVLHRDDERQSGAAARACGHVDPKGRRITAAYAQVRGQRGAPRSDPIGSR